MLDELFDLPDRCRHLVTTLLWHCGAAGRVQQQRLTEIAHFAAVDATLRRAIERELVRRHPLLPRLRERVAAGAYGDDRDAFTPLERERLRFAVWLRERGRLGDEG